MNTVTTGTALMLLCGIVGAACSGAASAATSDDDVPSVAIHYDPQSLDTDSGARALYRRIVNAAAEVCPELCGQSAFHQRCTCGAAASSRLHAPS